METQQRTMTNKENKISHHRSKHPHTRRAQDVRKNTNKMSRRPVRTKTTKKTLDRNKVNQLFCNFCILHKTVAELDTATTTQVPGTSTSVQEEPGSGQRSQEGFCRRGEGSMLHTSQEHAKKSTCICFTKTKFFLTAGHFSLIAVIIRYHINCLYY